MSHESHIDMIVNQQEPRCGYELCKRTDPILITPGHRPRRYHGDTCRQAQHRLAKERKKREERRGAPDDCEGRIAYLELKLAQYRAVIDLEDRSRLEQQFMACGELLNYRCISKYHIDAGLHSWEAYQGRTDDITLAEAILSVRELLEPIEQHSRNAIERSELRKAKREVTRLRKLEEALRLQLAEQDLRLAAEAKRLAEDRVTVIHGKHQRATQLVSELKRLLAQQAQENQALVATLQRQLARYQSIIDLDVICPWTQLTTIQCYLRDHPGAAATFTRDGKVYRIFALDDHARAVSESRGLIRLNDEEIEQCQAYVTAKIGRFPSAESFAVGQGDGEENAIEQQS